MVVDTSGYMPAERLYAVGAWNRVINKRSEVIQVGGAWLYARSACRVRSFPVKAAPSRQFGGKDYKYYFRYIC